MLPSFSTDTDAGSINTSVFTLVGSTPGALPEGTGFVVEDVDVDHPVQLLHGFSGFAGVGAGAGRILSPGEKAVDLLIIHGIKDIEP